MTGEMDYSAFRFILRFSSFPNEFVTFFITFQLLKSTKGKVTYSTDACCECYGDPMLQCSVSTIALLQCSTTLICSHLLRMNLSNGVNH